MREIGLMTKLMGMEYILMQMGLSTKATGKRINRMVMEFKHGQIRLVMKEIMSKAKSKVLANLHGLMAPTIRESFKIIIFMGKVGISDLIFECVIIYLSII